MKSTKIIHTNTRRAPVRIILDLLAAGETYAGVRKAYPDIADEDIQACIGYAAMLAEEEVGVAA